MERNKPATSQEWVDPDDAPVLTDAMLADAEEFVGNTFVRRGRGRPKSGAAKEQISVRLDPDVLAKLREAGPGWQSQINTLLRDGLVLTTAPDDAATTSRVFLQPVSGVRRMAAKAAAKASKKKGRKAG
jgi:uncharacterized protein (DUF4415 family)